MTNQMNKIQGLVSINPNNDEKKQLTDMLVNGVWIVKCDEAEAT